MPQTVTCPQCAQRLNIPDSFLSSRAKCPKCGGAIDVPSPSSATDPASTAVREERATSFAATQTQKPEASGVSLGLGIAALVIGLLAFVLALIPCLGMFVAVPLGALGVTLAIVGAAIAFSRQGAGIGFPIAGGVVNVVAIIIAVGWFFGSQYLLRRGAESAQKGLTDAMENIETTTQPMVLDNPPPNTVWTNANEPMEINGIRVKVVSARIGKVQLKRLSGSNKPSNGEYITVNLSIENRTPNRPVHYQSWGHFADSSYVRDNVGNVLGRVQFGMMHPEGQSKDMMRMLQPGNSTTDVIVFTKPSDGIKHLRLALPAQSVGGSGYFRFEIPADMVQK